MTSTGQTIEAAVLPFVFSKHKLTRKEFEGMVAKPVTRAINEKVALIQKWYNEGRVTINGMTYVKGQNDYSFFNEMKEA